MKKHFLLFTLCSIASCQLEAMGNNDEIEARRWKTEVAATGIWLLAASTTSTAALSYLTTITDSWQGRKRYLGSAVWFGASALVSFTTNVLSCYSADRLGRRRNNPFSNEIVPFLFLIANPIAFNAARRYMSYQHGERGTFAITGKFLSGSVFTFVGGVLLTNAYLG